MAPKPKPASPQSVSVPQRLANLFTEIANLRHDMSELVERVDKNPMNLDQTAVENLKKQLNLGNSISNNIEPMVTAMGIKQLANDNHNRKWCVIIYGVAGKAGEEVDETLEIIQKFGQEKLKLPQTRFSAIHRLSRDENASIIARFAFLGDKEKWLRAASKLTKEDGVSIIPDIAPALRPSRKKLLMKRRALLNDPMIGVKKVHLKYLPSWPFLRLHVMEGPVVVATHDIEETKESILQSYFDINGDGSLKTDSSSSRKPQRQSERIASRGRGGPARGSGGPPRGGGVVPVRGVGECVSMSPRGATAAATAIGEDGNGFASAGEDDVVGATAY